MPSSRSRSAGSDMAVPVEHVEDAAGEEGAEHDLQTTGLSQRREPHDQRHAEPDPQLDGSPGEPIDELL